MVALLLGVDGKPARIHMLLGRPLVCSVAALYASGVVGSFALAAGTPVPDGQAVPVVSRKYTVLTPLLPLPLV